MNIYESKKYTFPVIFEDEEWKDITEEMIPGILPIYKISNYGRLYNSSTDLIVDYYQDSRGYLVVCIKTINGKKNMYLHRIINIAWNPIPNPSKFVTNHLDGNKSHDYPSNLEWTTQKGNTDHAFNTGLRHVGGRSNHHIFTDEEVDHICRCMEAGYTKDQISMEVFGRPADSQIRTLLINIYGKKFWTSISYKYDIDNYKKNQLFSDKDIHCICQMMQNNPNRTAYEILLNIGLDMSLMDTDTCLRYVRCLSRIIDHKDHTDISSQYDF